MSLPLHPVLIQCLTLLVLVLIFALGIRYFVDKIPMPSDDAQSDNTSPFDSLK